jgi:hypothetical protein
MKISLERLNEIIEEEVRYFRELNEQVAPVVKTTEVAQLIKDNVKVISNVDALRNALLTAVGKIQDVSTLKQIQGILNIQDRK